MARRNVPTLNDIGLSHAEVMSLPPFRQCNLCDGSDCCRTFQDQHTVRRFLREEVVQLFRGTAAQVRRNAQQGCALARLLKSSLPSRQPNVVFSVKKAYVAGAGRRTLGLVSLLEGDDSGWQRQCRQLGVVTGPYDHAAKFVVGRPVDPDPVSPRTLLAIELWLGSCTSGREGHAACPKWEHEASKLPTRVVDVRQDVPRLYTPKAGEVGQYAALSYCWGGPQPHSTTDARVAAYHNGLPTGSLPATIQDAIAMTRALLIPFLWVDSLCIIQDSAEDKLREITNMGNIYKSSYVTLSASRAEHCNAGFLGIQEATRDRLRLSVTLLMSCPDGMIGNVMLYPAKLASRNMKNGDIPTDKRAWTYQEFLLSPRVVSFHHDGVEFKCARGLLSDGWSRVEELTLVRSLISRQAHLFPAFYGERSGFLGRLRRFGRGTLTSSERKSLHRLWDTVVLEYSMGRLTDPDDKLPALSAVASEFHRLWGGRYLAGLWDHQLVHDLQWHTSQALDDSGPKVPSRVPAHGIPSWSWASICSKVVLPLSITTSVRVKQSSRVHVMDCRVELVSEHARFGSVNGGKLTIRGPLKSMNIEETWKCFGRDSVMLNTTARFGRLWSDLRYEAPDDGTPWSKLKIPPESGRLFFIGLSMRPQDCLETCGLVLLETGNNRYERAGLFRLGINHPNDPSRAQRNALSQWWEGCEVKTISIF